MSMTQEEKQLLLKKDLCARFPYGVKFPYHIEEDSNHRECDCVAVMDSINDDCVEFTYEDNGHSRDWSCPLFQVKPYLRPLSSMTEEEYKSVSWEGCSHTYNYSLKSGFRFVEIKTFTLNILNWLNANHFDYRGLIPMGLALEAKEGIYKTE